MNFREIRILMIIYFLFIILTFESNYSICFFYNVTKLPCPGCGITLAIQYLLKGDLVNAFKTHFFSVFIFIGIILIFLSYFYKNISLILEKLLDKKIILIFSTLILIYGIIRLFILLFYKEYYPLFFNYLEKKTIIEFFKKNYEN